LQRCFCYFALTLVYLNNAREIIRCSYKTISIANHYAKLYLDLYLNFLFNSVLQFFKTIQFYHLQFDIRLVHKLNYNLYIHVTIIFFQYIHQIISPKYLNYFTFYIFYLCNFLHLKFFTLVKNKIISIFRCSDLMYKFKTIILTCIYKL